MHTRYCDMMTWYELHLHISSLINLEIVSRNDNKLVT